MSKAEERANEAHPDIPLPHLGDGIVAKRGHLRRAYTEGYEQAKKDLALKIEDLELIHTFLYAVKNNKHGAFTFTRLSDEQYREVLNRFNKSKEVK